MMKSRVSTSHLRCSNVSAPTVTIFFCQTTVRPSACRTAAIPVARRVEQLISTGFDRIMFRSPVRINLVMQDNQKFGGEFENFKISVTYHFKRRHLGQKQLQGRCDLGSTSLRFLPRSYYLHILSFGSLNPALVISSLLTLRPSTI